MANLFVMASQCNHHLGIVILLIFTLAGVDNIKMDKFNTVVRARDEIIINCETGVPLVECNMQINSDMFYDLSEGVNFKPLNNYSGTFTGLRYYGDGLEHGHCGMVVAFTTNNEYYTIGCRARAKRGPWEYDYTKVYVINESENCQYIGRGLNGQFVVKIEPHNAVFLEGRNAAFSCNQHDALTLCNISTSADFPESDDFYNVTLYSKMTRERNTRDPRCELMLTGLTEENNGWVNCRATRSRNAWSEATTQLIIAKPPTDDVELLVTTSELNGDHVLEAECAVGESRPPANITWYFGGKTVPAQHVEELPYNKWTWGHLLPEKRRQKLRLPVNAQDDKKEVTCRVTHLAMSGEFERSYLVNYNNTSDETPTPFSSFIAEYQDIIYIGLALVFAVIIVVAVVLWMRQSRVGCFRESGDEPVQETNFRMSVLEEDLYDDVINLQSNRNSELPLPTSKKLRKK